MKKKIGVVVQRYGLEVNGGAELHCRQLVEHLACNYDIEIITTKAIDYVTWKDEYIKDLEEINGIKVRRFSVEKERKVKQFNSFSEKIMGSSHTIEDENKWIDMQGPFAPEMLKYISENSQNYDAFIFFTYLYYNTCKGLPLVKDKAILIPTAHDEPPIYLKVFEEFFNMPKGIFYNTIEEKRFVEEKFNNRNIMNNGGFGGVGVDIPSRFDMPEKIKQLGNTNYVVYVGRIDQSKGCEELFNFYLRYKKENQNIKLVLIGKAVMDIPKNEDIISLGFVSDEEKFAVVQNAKFLIMPSQFESLSMVVLESLIMKTPVLVNGKCHVLKGHCINSNAGLYYSSYYQFEGCMNYLLSHEDKRKIMGQNGQDYVNKTYNWTTIIENLSEMIEKVVETK